MVLLLRCAGGSAAQPLTHIWIEVQLLQSRGDEDMGGTFARCLQAFLLAIMNVRTDTAPAKRGKEAFRCPYCY